MMEQTTIVTGDHLIALERSTMRANLLRTNSAEVSSAFSGLSIH